MCDETPIVPSGPLIVPSTTLLLLTGVERAVVDMIAAPKISLSLLVEETTTALITPDVPAILAILKASAIVLLTRRMVPIRDHRTRLVGPHTAAVTRVHRLLDRGWGRNVG